MLQGESERRKRCVSEALTAFYLQPLSGVLLSSSGPPPPSRCGRRTTILGSSPRRSALIFKASLSASAPPHGPLPLLMLSFAEVGRWAGRAQNCLHRFVRESLCCRCLRCCLVLAERWERRSRSHSEPWEHNHICLARWNYRSTHTHTLDPHALSRCFIRFAYRQRRQLLHHPRPRGNHRSDKDSERKKKLFLKSGSEYHTWN